ncbi:lipid transfer-like protein VAS [Carica papaya]|uniref:lipid transfer-like protein VAS n=1 Tax=Carica papaya TaxID=3649 RepID=UPI000B8CB0D4|nr:lipid transfer-like protein VAS [Carica papaya]
MKHLWVCYAIASLIWADLFVETLAQDSACLNQLLPCLNHLQGSQDVPDSCCDPLKSIIKHNPECFCYMVSNQGSNQVEQAGINISEAQQLPARCGLHVNPLACITGYPESRNSSGANIFLSLMSSMTVAIILSMALQILWVSNIMVLA